MNWDRIQREGLEKGYMVYAMDQGQTAPMQDDIGPWGSTRNGYCTGMTVRWVSMHYGATEFAFDQRTRELADLDWRSTRDHNRHRGDPSTFPTDYANALQRYGLTIDHGTVLRKQPVNLEQIFTKGLRRNKCFNWRGGHAYRVMVREGWCPAPLIRLIRLEP